MGRAARNRRLNQYHCGGGGGQQPWRLVACSWRPRPPRIRAIAHRDEPNPFQLARDATVAAWAVLTNRQETTRPRASALPDSVVRDAVGRYASILRVALLPSVCATRRPAIPTEQRDPDRDGPQRN